MGRPNAQLSHNGDSIHAWVWFPARSGSDLNPRESTECQTRPLRSFDVPKHL
uniref:Uncharacterized protein n=1 Tax=Arundo donax TaxID=35708 RepID=A0A0A9BJW9_ARUDO